ncbi:tyrosine-protein phosphatase [Rhodococcus sp. NPDC003318]|uniref:tyrosine-protein phosphatase n=1 Tax=Rhodococcus sp. NPDC003318 TaxID=3364503 RepID=UPI0036940223
MTSTLPLRAATRRLPLAGTYNFRDVGGYAVGERFTRWGKLFRSDALHAVDQTGRDTLAGLGLGLVVDLRENDERETAPNALNGVGHRDVHVPVYDGPIEYTASDHPGAAFDLEGLYLQMLREHGGALTNAVRLIAASGDAPVLVHCTAGKDRTGLVVALTLSAVGVDDRDVIADYALSETMLHGEWADAMLASFRDRELPDGFDVEGVVSASPAPLMRRTLAVIEADHGGARRYLLAHGMTESELTDLRAAILS